MTLPGLAATAARCSPPSRREFLGAIPSRLPAAFLPVKTTDQMAGLGPTRKLPPHLWTPPIFQRLQNGLDLRCRVRFHTRLQLGQAGSHHPFQARIHAENLICSATNRARKDAISGRT